MLPLLRIILYRVSLFRDYNPNRRSQVMRTCCAASPFIQNIFYRRVFNVT
jgi:hypothetical protein